MRMIDLNENIVIGAFCVLDGGTSRNLNYAAVSMLQNVYVK